VTLKKKPHRPGGEQWGEGYLTFFISADICKSQANEDSMAQKQQNPRNRLHGLLYIG
jgi:hypothetical protein